MTKSALLIHNPGAGEGGPSKADIIAMVEAAGFDCKYLSVKEQGWKNQAMGKVDFLIAAGGDGTVRKLVNYFMEKNLYEHNPPIGLLPIGTANNIANALGVAGMNIDAIVSAWKEGEVRNFDISGISGLSEMKIFIEGFGYGMFPYLVRGMKERNPEDYRGNKMSEALERLNDIIPTFPARHCHLDIDGKIYEGKFLLVEVLNIQAIGPNLRLAPFADPGDGCFDVVLVTEEQREGLANYVRDKLKGKADISFFTTMKAKSVKIHSEERLLHVDDKIEELDEPRSISAEIMGRPLQFVGKP